jgi:fumarate hydratase subunit beta
MPKHIKLPLTDKTIAELKTGDNVLLRGVIYVARDAAHKKIVEAFDKGQPLPFDIKGQTIYYMGPAPARPGNVIGSAGPTTSSRMDSFSPRLMEIGLKGMIGKGQRTEAVCWMPSRNTKQCTLLLSAVPAHSFPRVSKKMT